MRKARKPAETTNTVVTPDTAPAPAPELRSNEITVDHAAFKRALGRITSVVDKGSTMPMLANVAIRSRGDAVEIVGTDLDVWLTVELATGKGSARGGMTTSAHKLSALVKTMPKGEVSIRLGERDASVIAGPITARVTTLPDRDYPKIPSIGDGPWTTVDAVILRNAIEAVMFSVCRDQTRFHLNGALLESDGETLTVVTTDGHRLTKVRQAWVGPVLSHKGILIPSKGLQEIRKLLTGARTCEIGVGPVFLFVRVDGATLAIKLTDAQFPPYEQVIPKDNCALLTVERAPLVDALKRSRLLACETRGARFELADGSLTIATDDPDQGDVREPLPADYCGIARKWGFNPRYMLELLDEVTDTSITIAFKGDLDPCLIRSTDDAAMRSIGHAKMLGVIMPMRI